MEISLVLSCVILSNIICNVPCFIIILLQNKFNSVLYFMRGGVVKKVCIWI